MMDASVFDGAFWITAAAILDGRVQHAILLELFTELGAGTLIE